MRSTVNDTIGRRGWLPLAIACLLASSAARGGDGRVAVQGADPSCGDDSGAVYVDCGNGTVTDNRTGLVWLADADCLGGPVEWEIAMGFATGLADLPDDSAAADHDCGLSDGSLPGEWRLPSLFEWTEMIADAMDLGCEPQITSDDASVPPCWSVGCQTAGLCSFLDVASASYWSSSHTFPSFPNNVWTAPLNSSDMFLALPKDSTAYAWPVRGGQ